jgi:hypothetical protein
LFPASPASGATAIFGLGRAIPRAGIAMHTREITIDATRTEKA